MLLPLCTTATSLREQIGQLIIVGFDGTELSTEHPVVEAITKHNIGGVILYDVNTQKAIVQENGSATRSPRNIDSPEQLRLLTQALQARARIPLFIAIDQEGGRVARLNPNNGFPASPSHKALAYETPEKALNMIRANAKILKEHGINLNFAPVVDIEIPGNYIASKERCFSQAPEAIISYAEIYIRAHREEGVLCTAKHFPGHGSTQGDSHLGFVDATQTWSPAELVPYTALIQKQCLDAVLTAHIYLMQRDTEHPASLSPKVLTHLLREQLGYQGLIITDDLNMGAIEKSYPLPEAAVQALYAGSDIILICHSLMNDPKQLEIAIDAVESAVLSGRLSQASIDASYQRVLRAKQEIGLMQASN